MLDIKFILENQELMKQNIANVLLGLQTLYDDRFSQFMEVCLSHQPEKMCRAYIDLIR